MKLLVMALLLFARHTITVQSDNGTKLGAYFTAKAGDVLHVTVDCNFTNYLCLAGPPLVFYEDGTEYTCPEADDFYFTATEQEQIYTCRLQKGGEVWLNLPGWYVRAQYEVLVQDNGSI
jgi:hypothetical protein